MGEKTLGELVPHRLCLENYLTQTVNCLIVHTMYWRSLL